MPKPRNKDLESLIQQQVTRMQATNRSIRDNIIQFHTIFCEDRTPECETQFLSETLTQIGHEMQRRVITSYNAQKDQSAKVIPIRRE